MTFRQNIAKYVTEHATTAQLPDIAMIGLEEGLDSPSLRILAGLYKNENPFQVEEYFKRALQELNISLPGRRQAAIEYGVAIAGEIILNRMDLINWHYRNDERRYISMNDSSSWYKIKGTPTKFESQIFELR